MPAIMFTDVEGSVPLYRRLGDEAALRIVNGCNRRIARTAEKHGGRVIKFMGDGVMVLFPEISTALAAAIACQSDTGLADGGHAAPPRIRIGLHCGDVIEASGDCFGDTVNVAARLCAVAHGGEILTTRMSVEGVAAEYRARLRPLGAVSLKGVGRPIDVVELLWDLPSTLTVALPQSGVIPSDVRLQFAIGAAAAFAEPLDRPITIGREKGQTFVLGDPRASRAHASIDVRGMDCILTDHSTNGTIVRFSDGEPVELRRQDIALHGWGWIGCGFDPIEFGEGALRFRVLNVC